MSEFFDNTMHKCPRCGTWWASCEGGPNCDCWEYALDACKDEEEEE